MNGGGGPGSTFGFSCSCNKGAFSLVSGSTGGDGSAETPKLSAILRSWCHSRSHVINRAKYRDVIGIREPGIK